MSDTIEVLEAEYQKAKKASDEAYRKMWADPKNKALEGIFCELFKAKGRARRALEAATGERLNPLYETDTFAVAKTLEGDRRDDNAE